MGFRRFIVIRVQANAQKERVLDVPPAKHTSFIANALSCLQWTRIRLAAFVGSDVLGFFLSLVSILQSNTSFDGVL